jgi:hypothetical protein
VIERALEGRWRSTAAWYSGIDVADGRRDGGVKSKWGIKGQLQVGLLVSDFLHVRWEIYEGSGGRSKW